MTIIGYRLNGVARSLAGVRLNGQTRTLLGLEDPTYGAGVIAPAGWGSRWRTYRDTGSATTRRELVVFGDSTTYGSEGMYSYVQQVRNRAVAAGVTDGGKGIFAAGEADITYDAPEVNGFVSSTFTGVPDSYDSLTGQYYYSTTAGQVLTLRARSTAFRLWYVARNTAGQFTYAVDGGSAVTVDADHAITDPLDRFVYVSGLAADTTHTVVITNTSGADMQVALAPVNAVGLAVQKQATSGGTVLQHFHGGLTDYTGPHNATRYQAPLGLLPTSRFDGPTSPTSADDYAAGNVQDNTTGAPRPILAMFNLGFNDLTTQANTDFTRYTEGIRKFAAACRARSCDGIVSTGNMPVNANWPTYGAALYAAYRDTAADEGMAFVDMWEPFGGALDYTGGTANPHLTKAQYVAQGNFLWDNLLGV